MSGKPPASQLKAELSERAAKLRAMGHTPRLAAVMAGENEASSLYLARKGKLGRELGITVDEYRMGDVSQHHLIALLRQLSADDAVDGILLEQPLPMGMDRGAVLQAIAPDKDVDGATSQSRGIHVGGHAGLAPATPLAVMGLLQAYGITLAGKETVIVGHSPVVGKPLALMLLHADATVTVCHKATVDLAAHTRRADLLVVAVGVPGLVTGSMVKPGATVVDVGINIVNGRTVGDVEFESVSRVAGALTPVPGGVGPVTTLTILANTLQSAERRSMAMVGAAD